MTITHVAAASAAARATPQHESLALLVTEAARLPERPGLGEVLTLLGTALEHGALGPELAHRLGVQVRLLAGPEPLDEADLDGHLLLQHLVFELSEVAAQVDGVHVDELGPSVDALLDAGDEAGARRLMLLGDAARSRLRTLLGPLAGDLGAA